jgi:ribosomal protein S18 acetylase RimI-like enzyme
MRYKIRTMTARDYEAVVSLWRTTPGIGLDDDSDSKSGITRYLRRNPGTSFVACCGDGIVGAVLSGHDGRRGYLHHLAVAASHQRHGVGSGLVARCLRALASRRIPKCNVFLFHSNAGGRAFWIHHGWKPRRDLQVLQKET